LTEAKQVLAEQAELRVESSDEINPIHRQLMLDLKQAQGAVAGYQARQTELTKQKEAVLADLREANNSQLQLDQLTQQAQLTRDNYLQYARNLEEARIDKELENDKISNLSILQPAMLSERPVSPSKQLVAAAMFLMAAASTAGLVLLDERRHTPAGPIDTYSTPRRRDPRRRAQRELASKTNGQSL